MKRNELILKNISKKFIADDNMVVTALKDLELSIADGEFVCILGKTGCGKTTLLRIIAGLENEYGGSISLDGRTIDDIYRSCSLVFQQYSLFPWMNVLQNIGFPLESKNIAVKERERISREFLKLVGLSEFEKSQPYELSGGMQQRVSLARAFAYDPEILLMDEPFGALDEETRKKLQDLLLEIWSTRKKTVIFVTHNIDEAILLADRILVMSASPGRIIEEIKIDFPRPRRRLDDNFSNTHLKLRNILELS